jgi:hypothetical protein
MTSAADPATLEGQRVAPTLDAVFRTNVRRTPGLLALVDPPDRASFTTGAERRLTYAEVDRAVERLVARIGALKLLPGAVVATQLPNTVEAIITLLALWRADLVAAPLPLLWRRAEAAQALHRVDARALIAAGPVASAGHAEIALETAAAAFNVRYVCGFGDDLADGLVPLGDIFAEGEAASEATGANETSGRPRIVTFDMTAEGPMPAIRADAQLLVGGLSVVLEAGLPQAARVLATMLPTSFAVVAATVVPWLLSGGTLRLHHPFAPATLAAQLAEPHDVAVLPGALVPLLVERGLIGGVAERRIGGVAERRIVGIWRAPEQQAVSPVWQSDGALIDVLAFGELAIVPRRRVDAGAPAPLHAAPIGVPTGADPGVPIVTLARSSHGTLMLSGPMLPAGGSAAPADSGYSCKVDPATQGLVIGAPPAGLAQVGGYRFAMAALQDVIGRADAGGVLAALPDLLAGQKLAGAASNPASIRQTLTALGLSPIVTGAFREKGAA